jgi:pSer/pThr/pTyr-binding forkhead associated (FHA) protein
MGALELKNQESDFYILGESAEIMGKKYPLLVGRTTIGRGDAANIKIDDVKLSRVHAEFYCQNKKITITDLNSQNGILVNNNKVKQHELKKGDQVLIGGFWYIVGEVGTSDKATTKSASKKNNILLYGLVASFIGVLMTWNEQGGTNTSDASRTKRSFNEVNTSLSKKLNDLENKKISQVDKEVNVIIKRGLRELRESNYYRAMLEFNHALDLNPRDSQANFYLRKTQDQLDQIISQLNIAAERDKESLHYQRAMISYCTVTRLLYNFKEDKRIEEAKVKMTALAQLMGIESIENYCH